MNDRILDQLMSDNCELCPELCRFLGRHNPDISAGTSQPSLISDPTSDPTSDATSDPASDPEAKRDDKRINILFNLVFILWNVLFGLQSVLSTLLPIGVNIAIAGFYYINNDYWYCGLTLGFTFLSAFVLILFSKRWHDLKSRREGSPNLTNSGWTFRFIYSYFFGPILRYIEIFKFGLILKRLILLKRLSRPEFWKLYFEFVNKKNFLSKFLKLFEGCIQTATQVVLQFYILAKNSSHERYYWIVVVNAVRLVSLSSFVVVYNRALKDISFWRSVNLFFWHLLWFAFRVTALALFASEYRFYITIVCLFHLAVMYRWIDSMKIFESEDKPKPYVLNAFFAALFMFCYINPEILIQLMFPKLKRISKLNEKQNYIQFYYFSFCENIVLISLSVLSILLRTDSNQLIIILDPT